MKTRHTDDGIDRDQIHTLLADEALRGVLEYLGSNGGSVQISELAAYLVEDDTRTSPANEREARITLHHAHLPRLSDSDAVEYDRDGGRVTLTPTGEQVDGIREQIADVLDDWSA